MDYYFFLDDCSLAGAGGPSIEWHVVIQSYNRDEYKYFVIEYICHDNSPYFIEPFYYSKIGPLDPDFVKEFMNYQGALPNLKAFSKEDHGWIIDTVEEEEAVNLKPAKQ
jgi:hypothetical protein